jgi:hypothetical protein
MGGKVSWKSFTEKSDRVEACAFIAMMRDGKFVKLSL